MSNATSASPLLAGIDVGTTNIKAVIFDPTGQPVAQASVSTPTYYPQPEWAYYQPEEMWQRTAQVLRQATSQLDHPQRIVSVAVASIGEAAVPLDAHGQPAYESIAWFDRRTMPQVAWLDEVVGRDRLFDISGLSLQPIFGLCKLLWLKQNQPEAYARTKWWLNMADYITYRLCGVAATDYSLASRTLALNLQNLTWDADLLGEIGIAPGLLAPLCVAGTPLGPITPEAAAATGLPTSATVAAGGHDHVCGALAVGAAEPGVMLNSLGSAEAIFMPIQRPITDPALGRQGYTQGAHVIAGHYYVIGGLYTSGASVEWWREILGTQVEHATLIAEAEQVAPGSLGVCFLPHLRLADPPHDDPKGRAVFVGLNTDAKRGVLFRAILEGLAYESRSSLEALLKFPNMAALRKIYAIGGSTRNRLLMQIKASVLNRPITVAAVAESTSLGAAILGGLGAGVYPDVPTALQQLRHEQTVVEPVADQVAYYEAYFQQIYQQLYLTLRPLHHIIYQLQNKEEFARS
jgi:xylulokinase